MKTKTIFSCNSCGYQSLKWLGRCPDCEAWNSLVEELQAEPKMNNPGYSFEDSAVAVSPVLLKDLENTENLRLKTNISELDRVLGGGIVKGGVILLGGDPGIGKSTIALQIAHAISCTGQKVLYISAEESVNQTRLRAQRLGITQSQNIYIVSQTGLNLILEYINTMQPDCVVIDSIQVIFNPDISSSPGSVSQVRECAHILTRLAKAKGIAMLIIGHVTKDGSIAGPRVLEHVVDTVLYFEGERYAAYRILRAVKNRYGSTNEIGVFQMGENGLSQVGNLSQFFLTERPKDTSGSVVTSVIEGSRPMLLEIQALVSRSSFGYPSRRSQGFDSNRLNLIVAVLEKRLGLNLANEDIFLNVAGGIKVDDPACDLAVAVAITSSFKDQKVKNDCVVIGEVGLACEIRSVSQASLRVQEAQRIGFKQCLLPKSNGDEEKNPGIELIPVSNVQEALEAVLE